MVYKANDTLKQALYDKIRGQVALALHLKIITKCQVRVLYKDELEANKVNFGTFDCLLAKWQHLAKTEYDNADKDTQERLYKQLAFKLYDKRLMTEDLRKIGKDKEEAQKIDETDVQAIDNEFAALSGTLTDLRLKYLGTLPQEQENLIQIKNHLVNLIEDNKDSPRELERIAKTLGNIADLQRKSLAISRMFEDKRGRPGKDQDDDSDMIDVTGATSLEFTPKLK